MGKYVNKESLTQALSINLNLSKKDAAFAVDLIFNEMSDALASDGHVDITAFGKFEIFDRKSRMGINDDSGYKTSKVSSKSDFKE